MKNIKIIFPYIFLSITAALLTLIIILTKSSKTIAFEDKIIITGAFIMSCLFGISIAISPNWWKNFIQKKDHTSNLQSEKTTRSYLGHHPDCSMFKSHIIMIKNKPRCAGCFGLIFGSTISLLLIIIFLFILPELSLITLYFILIIGFFLLTLVYIEIIYPIRYASSHLILNITLILGFLCLTISVLEITGNLFYGILTIILCFLWLDTRIQLSRWNHIKMCNNCPDLCKMYKA